MLIGSTSRRAVRFLLLVVSVPVFSAAVLGQDITKKPLDHDSYDLWNTISRQVMSDDGQWVMYSVQSGAIDGPATTHLFHPASGKRYELKRATNAIFTHDSERAIYRVQPEKDSDDKTSSKNQRPQLQVLELSSGKILMVDGVRSFAVPAESGRWLSCSLDRADSVKTIKSDQANKEVYGVTPNGLEKLSKPIKLKSREKLKEERGELQLEKELEASANSANSQSKGGSEKTETKEEANDKEKEAGHPLLVIDLFTGMRQSFPNVNSSKFSKDGEFLAMVTSVASETQTKKNQASNKEELAYEDGVHLLRLSSMDHVTLLAGVGEYRALTFSDDSNHLAFMSNRDDYKAKSPSWSVYLTASQKPRVQQIATEGSDGIPSEWWIAPQSSLLFSDDSARLYFDTVPIADDVIEERKGRNSKNSSADKEKKAKLDLWHWKDPQLQPQQLLRAQSEKSRTYQAAYAMGSKRVIQIERRAMPSVSVNYRSKASLAVANNTLPYRKSLSWDYPGFQDVYLVDLNTGAPTKVAEKVRWNASLSPEGKFITWFDAEKRQWFTQSTVGKNAKPVQVSKGIRHPLQDELHDTPNLPRPYGAAGWLANDEALLIYDSYDIWQVDPTGKQSAKCLTLGAGRQQKIRFRYLRLDAEQISIDPNETILLSAFHTETKASGYFQLSSRVESKLPELPPKQLIMLDERLSGIQKSKQGDGILFSRSTFRHCPDLWYTDVEFKNLTRVSDINPQQEQFSWGSAELVHWDSKDRKPLDGILLKPDGFDPTKKYPMLVYFYERNSDNLHRYYTPAAGRSIICHSFYVSRGYLVFIPDIPYTTGEPGQSAVKAILPGVDHIVSQGFVKEDKIGIQGHSWGGYQTAYLVTQTDRFACAESGAPVSNMTSAYGGIRWGSGMSRMFQYERTQSRIGEDLWSAREKYLANSPLFFADKIHTPLLILHNDQDGAVPWYQGIELFVALRRLGRPAWMLNYNGEPHWVMDDYNRRDFAKRMQQFFDHYLQDAPEPEWMAAGIPATQKGENFGFELLEPLESTAPVAESD